MASNLQWEVVRKQPKKSKENVANNSKLTKNQVRDYLEKMPKLSEAAPLKESRTMFDAFLEKSKTSENNTQVSKKNAAKALNSAKTSGSVASNKEGNKQKKKHVDKKKGQQAQSLEEAIKNINFNELKTLMTMVQLRFPDSPNIWLKDLISYLNIKISFDIQELSFRRKDYLSYSLPEDLHLIIMDTLGHCHDQLLQPFFEQAVVQMADDITKGLKTHGYRIILQIVAHERPAMYAKIIKKCAELCESYKNRPPVCLSIFWILGQFGVHDFKAGFKVWSEIFLPLIGLRFYSKHVVDYLQALLSWHSSKESNAIVIDVREFFLLLDTFFIGISNVDLNIYNELLAIYPKLKDAAFCSNSDMHTFFPSFLSRLNPTCSRQFKAELLSCLMTCLKTDEKCYLVWRQMSSSHLIQSSILLDHILKNCDKYLPELDKRPLKNVLNAFITANTQICNRKSDKVLESLPECADISKMLLMKMSARTSFARYLAFTAAFSIAFSIGIYFYLNPIGLQESKMGQLLLKLDAHFYYKQAVKNVSDYSAFIYKVGQPYFHIFSAWIGSLGKMAWELLTLFHNFILKNVPIFLKWVDGWLPDVLITIDGYLTDIWELFWQIVTLLCSYIWSFIV